MKSWFDPFEFGTGARPPRQYSIPRWGLIPPRYGCLIWGVILAGYAEPGAVAAGAPHMDLVASHDLARERPQPAEAAEDVRHDTVGGLLPHEGRLPGQEAQALDITGGRLDTIGISNRAAEHLEA